MLAEFDIFRVDEEGVLLWCAAVETLEDAEATAKKKNLAQSSKCEYVIFSQRSGNRLIITPGYAVAKRN
jgi:hypothetical protein